METLDIKKELGSAVRLRRKSLGLSQEALAERANLHRTYVTDIERGSRNISVESIYKLATALEIPIGSLFSSGDHQAALRQPNQSSAGDILLVEDNAKDVELTLAAFHNAKLTNHVHVARDGAIALDFLFCRGRYKDRNPENLPQLILLDLGLPKVHGLEVLRRVRENEPTRSLKVVVLSISRHDTEIREAMRLGASAFIFKPVDFCRFSEITGALDLCWTLRAPVPVMAGIS